MPLESKGRAITRCPISIVRPMIAEPVSLLSSAVVQPVCNL